MIDINRQKDRLLAEKARLETLLSTVARKNPNISGDWEPVENDLNTDQADESDVADAIENFELNSAETATLETSLSEVEDSLTDIEDGIYGRCSVCGNSIEDDRLEVFPSAKTCKLHM